MGSGRGPGGRLGRDIACGSSHGSVAPHDHGWAQGFATVVEEPHRCCHTCAVPGWWAPCIDSNGSGFAGGLGAVDRTYHAWRPDVPIALDLQEHRQLGRGIDAQNHPVSDRTVALLLKQSGYSLQANRKTREGSSHPDRNAQFEYINRQVLRLSSAKATGHLGGHEEEGIGRGIQKSG